MNIRELFKNCKSNAHDVVDYFKSPFYLWCKYHAPETEKDPESDYMKLIAERGNKHEDLVVQARHPGMTPAIVNTTEDILVELKKGVGALGNITIFDPDFKYAGKPDLLELNCSKPCKFGNFHYIVKEIKSVKDPKKRKDYIMQAAFYNYVLGLLQGYTPEIFYVIGGTGEEFAFEFSKYEADLKQALAEIAPIRAGTVAVSPTLDMPYPWENYSEKKAFESNDISLINGIGTAMKAKLNTIGIKHVEDLHKIDISELLKIKGVGDKTAPKFKRFAEALVKNEPIIFGKPSLPARGVEIFFDLEATMPDEELGVAEQKCYLFGVLIRKDGKEKFIPFTAERLDEEEKVFREFLDFVSKEKDFVIYHYAHFEKTHLNRMFEEYGIDEATKKKVSDNLLDLKKEVDSSVAFPTTKSGLKEIAKYLGFTWRHKEVNAQESMAMYLEFVNGDKEKLQKIIDYNEDDCRATRIIKDWLVTNIQSK